MGVHIALFRGINVRGNNVLRMDELKALLEGLGLRDVRTYIQSGNVVFRSMDGDVARLAGEIGAAIAARHGFTPEVLLLSIDELRAAIAANPFREAEATPKSLHLGFLAAAPDAPDLAALERAREASERFAIRERIFYLHAPDGIGRSRLANNAERLLGVPLTSRNWRTVCAIMALAEASALA